MDVYSYSLATSAAMVLLFPDSTNFSQGLVAYLKMKEQGLDSQSLTWMWEIDMSTYNYNIAEIPHSRITDIWRESLGFYIILGVYMFYITCSILLYMAYLVPCCISVLGLN